MKLKTIITTTALFFLLAAGTAGAATITMEGAIEQLTYDAFDINNDTISVDYWEFSVLTPGTVTIDVLSWERDPEDWSWVDVNGDGEDSFIDSYIHVFKGSLAAGNIYASNDDGLSAGRDDGTIRGNDSFISTDFEAGDYIIAVSSCGYTPFFSVEEAVAEVNNKAIIPYSRGEGDWGDYRVTITGDVSAVPVPAAAWLLGSGLAGLAALRKKRHAG